MNKNLADSLAQANMNTPSKLLQGAIRRLELTRRESELALLICKGWRSTDICEHLGISPATMRTHLRNVYANLGITGRTQLVACVLSSVLSDIRD